MNNDGDPVLRPDSVLGKLASQRRTEAPGGATARPRPAPAPAPPPAPPLSSPPLPPPAPPSAPPSGWWQASDGRWYPPEAHPRSVQAWSPPPRPVKEPWSLKKRLTVYALIIFVAILGVGVMIYDGFIDTPQRLEGKCVNLLPEGREVYETVSCDGPHELKVVRVVHKSADCPAGTEVAAKLVEDSDVSFLCVEPGS